MRKPLEPGYLDPNQNHSITGYGEWNEAFHALPEVKKKSPTRYSPRCVVKSVFH